MKEYELTPYPRKLWVEILSKETIKSLSKKYKYIDDTEILEKEIEAVGAHTLHCIRNKDGKYGIIVLIAPDFLTAPTFAHEAFHVVDCVADSCGLDYVKNAGNEHIAYLIQYIVSCLEDWYNKQIN